MQLSSDLLCSFSVGSSIVYVLFFCYYIIVYVIYILIHLFRCLFVKCKSIYFKKKKKGKLSSIEISWNPIEKKTNLQTTAAL